MKKSGNVVAQVTRIAEPTARTLGLDLWDVEYVKEGAEMILRITIDKPEGVTIEDCEAMHRAIDPLLDEADPIEGAYHLEVSSPGIERELRTDAHLRACEGWSAEVRLYAPADGAKVWTGTLLELAEGGEIRLACDPDGTVRTFPRSAVASVKTTYDFDAETEKDN